jgi:hypothetical protein
VKGNDVKTQRESKASTEADVKSANASSGSKRSSGNKKSHTKAGSLSGAGGGKKQQRHG